MKDSYGKKKQSCCHQELPRIELYGSSVLILAKRGQTTHPRHDTEDVQFGLSDFSLVLTGSGKGTRDAEKGQPRGSGNQVGLGDPGMVGSN